MDKEEFAETVEDGKKRFSIEQHTVLKEEADKQLDIDLEPGEASKRKISLLNKIEVPERYYKAKKIRYNLKEVENMLLQDEHSVDTSSEIAENTIEGIKDIKADSADLEELENFYQTIEKFIVEEKGVKSPELENQDEA
ncbi:MAG: hypothetical protein ABEJ87_02605 [Candidatus Nanohalobium sp.]